MSERENRLWTLDVDVSREVLIPSAPNFIRIAGEGDQFVDVKDLSDETLRSIGEAMIDRLISNAERRRGETT